MQLHEARYQEYSCELKTLLQLVESVHSNYEAGDTYALFYGIYVNSRVDMERLKKCFMAYGVIFMEPTQQNTATAYELGVIREAGLAGTKRMLMELKQLQGSDLDLNQAFARTSAGFLASTDSDSIRPSEFERGNTHLQDHLQEPRLSLAKRRVGEGYKHQGGIFASSR
ncbi:hypothetical protein C8R46DRAFT_1056988 [Mycena filopes]|nr:hypothetical protein C8R46DRAFT_1056988 [Mycena filopes]